MPTPRYTAWRRLGVDRYSKGLHPTVYQPRLSLGDLLWAVETEVVVVAAAVVAVVEAWAVAVAAVVVVAAAVAVVVVAVCRPHWEPEHWFPC